MIRQSISFTEPNDEWLKNQIANKEYSSKSELVNDLIRQARGQQKQIDFIRLKLERAENSGFTDETKSEILKQSKSLL
jgi:antitoxin ParD1/3/4